MRWIISKSDIIKQALSLTLSIIGLILLLNQSGDIFVNIVGAGMVWGGFKTSNFKLKKGERGW